MVGLVANGAAAGTGVQVGDVLVDMTLVSVGKQFVCNDTVAIGPGGLPATNGTEAIPAETLTEHHYPTEPVPFTDRKRIQTVTDYGLTLTLPVIRGKKTVELTIKPGGRGLPTN